VDPELDSIFSLENMLEIELEKLDSGIFWGGNILNPYAIRKGLSRRLRILDLGPRKRRIR